MAGFALYGVRWPAWATRSGHLPNALRRGGMRPAHANTAFPFTGRPLRLTQRMLRGFCGRAACARLLDYPRLPASAVWPLRSRRMARGPDGPAQWRPIASVRTGGQTLIMGTCPAAPPVARQGPMAAASNEDWPVERLADVSRSRLRTLPGHSRKPSACAREKASAHQLDEVPHCFVSAAPADLKIAVSKKRDRRNGATPMTRADRLRLGQARPSFHAVPPLRDRRLDSAAAPRAARGGRRVPEPPTGPATRPEGTRARRRGRLGAMIWRRPSSLRRRTHGSGQRLFRRA